MIFGELFLKQKWVRKNGTYPNSDNFTIKIRIDKFNRIERVSTCFQCVKLYRNLFLCQNITQ